jgi:hypothetical protein
MVRDPAPDAGELTVLTRRCHLGVPNPLTIDLESTVGSDLSGSGTLDGLPSTYHINIDHLPKIHWGIDPVDLTVKLKPVDLNLAIKDLASIRGHLPADFSVALGA